MDISIIATTHMTYVADKNEFDTLSGKAAGVCYMANTFDEILNEDKEISSYPLEFKRLSASLTKVSWRLSLTGR